MKVVLFLGAGFSRAFGYPVMSEFFEFADANIRISQEQKKFLSDLRIQARQANAFLESSPTNLEDILSFSEMEDRISLNEDQNFSNSQQVKRVIQRVFTDFNLIDPNWNTFDSLKRILPFKSENMRDINLSIITTNYDLSIECALNRFGSKAKLNFKAERERSNVRMVDDLYHDSGIPLFKLHGSVNWFKSESKTGIFVEDRIVDSYPHEKKNIPLVSRHDYSHPGEPLIIPPSFLKPELPKPLLETWKYAAKELQEANLLVFIGYSFPVSDTEMTYFLARSLTSNANLNKILLIDPIGDEIEIKLRSRESRFGSHFLSLLKAIQADWQDTYLEEYIYKYFSKR
jgi:hypothetical protein